MARKARKPSKSAVKAAADRAERRARGEPEPEVREPEVSGVKAEEAPPAPRAPKFGRPSKYKPEFCQRVVDLGFAGKGKAQMAAGLGIDRGTLNEWMKAHEEFSRAVSMGLELAMAWWQDQGQAGINLGKDFNGFVYSFEMRNRFRDDYSDKIDVRHDATASFKGIWAALADRGKAKSHEEAA